MQLELISRNFCALYWSDQARRLVLAFFARSLYEMITFIFCTPKHEQVSHSFCIFFSLFVLHMRARVCVFVYFVEHMILNFRLMQQQALKRGTLSAAQQTSRSPIENKWARAHTLPLSLSFVHLTSVRRVMHILVN